VRLELRLFDLLWHADDSLCLNALERFMCNDRPVIAQQTALDVASQLSENTSPCKADILLT